MSNTVIEFDEGYISYNPLDGEGKKDNVGREETALVINGEFYIIYGNHLDIVKDKSFSDILKYFLEREGEIAFWSNSFDGLKELNNND